MGRALVQRSAALRTLADRIRSDGPVSARDAVRLVARVAKTVESLHATGEVHGRLGPEAVALFGSRLANARLRRPASAPSVEGYGSPFTIGGRGEGPLSTVDDVYALALLLFFSLTGQGVDAREPSGKMPPLAVFDAGDDELEALLTQAFAAEPGGLHRLGVFRREIERWLEHEGAPVESALPWEDEAPRSIIEKPIDLSSLPPPPEPETPVASVGSEEVDEDRETLPGESPASGPQSPSSDKGARVAGSSPTQRPPKLVPPKLVKARKAKVETAENGLPSFEHDKDDKTPEAEPARAKGHSRAWMYVAGAAALGGVTLFVLSGRDAGPTDASAPPAEGTVKATAGTSTTSATAVTAAVSAAATTKPSAAVSTSASSPASGSASPPPTASSIASATPIASASGAADLPACVKSALAADTFVSKRPKDLEFICRETDVVKGGGRLRARIVLAGETRAVTDGMREWAMLGFYELAAFAILHERCCPEPKPVTAPASPEICKPAVAEAARRVSVSSRSESELEAALGEFDKAIRCAVRANQIETFGGHPRPSGGEATWLKKIVTRLRSSEGQRAP